MAVCNAQVQVPSQAPIKQRKINAPSYEGAFILLTEKASAIGQENTIHKILVE